MDEAFTDPEEELSSKFQRAANHMQSVVSKLDNETLLKFYGLYKQATVGVCEGSRPSWFQAQARQKWDAWNALKAMPPEAAMRFYVELMDKTDKDWDANSETTKSPSWVAVSCMVKEDDLDESDKTIFDYVKDGDVAKVAELHQKYPGASGYLDETMMGLIHWAADRGNLPVMELIVSQMNADVNFRDGSKQTPLHYAASCGHKDVVRFLIDRGADVGARDEDGCSPLDVACDETIVAMLRNVP